MLWLLLTARLYLKKITELNGSNVMSENTLRRPLHWKCAAQTDVGKVREVNEDALLVRIEQGLWAVADGMGVHEIGDIANKKVMETLAQIPREEELNTYVDRVEDALINVNQHIVEYGKVMLSNATMGSTVVSLIIHGHVGVCLWVGDSRLYRYRNKNLLQLSRDHSQVEEMLQMGLLSKDEAVNHPQANVITRAIGVEDQVFVDINVFNTQIGDTFLLCSDGLYSVVTDEKIAQAMTQKNVTVCVNELMSIALDNGAPDNVSIVVVRAEPGSI